jgi:hypothetical protein
MVFVSEVTSTMKVKYHEFPRSNSAGTGTDTKGKIRSYVTKVSKTLLKKSIERNNMITILKKQNLIIKIKDKSNILPP